VQVELHDVHTHVARPAIAHQAVQVGPIAIDQSTLGMDDLGDLGDVLLEEAEGVRVGDHDPRDLIIHDSSHGLGVEEPTIVGLDLLDAIPVQSARGGVCPVGRIGNQDPLPLLASGLVIRPDHADARELSLRPGRGVERDPRHAADLGEHGLEGVHELESALGELDRSLGMKPCEARL